jgi:hypothetical protein
MICGGETMSKGRQNWEDDMVMITVVKFIKYIIIKIIFEMY